MNASSPSPLASPSSSCTGNTRIEQRIREKLNQRRQNHSIRSLDLVQTRSPPRDANQEDGPFSSSSSSLSSSSTVEIDFCSNDYLGLAHSAAQHEMVELKFKEYTSSSSMTGSSGMSGSGSNSSNHTRRGVPPRLYLGSTGSRLLSGNSALCVELETFLASVHRRPAALVCNSGYDANLSLLSSLPLAQDVVIMDELCHNSLIMGVQMSRIMLQRQQQQQQQHQQQQQQQNNNHIWYFSHNDMVQLEQLLHKAKEEQQQVVGSSGGCIFVVVESVYSMDGDIAPLQQILDLSWHYNAHVIVDEAHGLGVYGCTNPPSPPPPPLSSVLCQRVDDTNATATVAATAADVAATDTINGGTGVLAALGLEEHPALLAGIFTFGKAAGCHGAVITGSCILMEYLVNYARPFIYSTSLPPHSLVTIKCAYDTMLGQEGEKRRNKVFCLVQLFRSKMMHGLQELYRRLNLTKAKKHNVENVLNSILLPSPSPIQAVMCPGNDHCVRVARRLRSEGGIAVFAIRSPTVPKGQERIRIILHAHNTEDEVLHLVHCLLQYAFLLDQTQEAYNDDDDDDGGGHGTLSHHEHGQKVPLQSKL